MDQYQAERMRRVLLDAAVLLCQASPRGPFPPWAPDPLDLIGPATVVVRWARVLLTHLHPFYVVPPPHTPTPPMVPYHDLRTVAIAAGLSPSRVVAPTQHRIRAIRLAASWSMALQRTWERRSGVTALDDEALWMIRQQGGRAMFAPDCPSSLTLATMLRRPLRACGLTPGLVHPWPESHGHLTAPLEDLVVEALGLADEPTTWWRLGNSRVPSDAVDAAHLAWYSRHPGVVGGILAREHARVSLLGLA